MPVTTTKTGKSTRRKATTKVGTPKATGASQSTTAASTLAGLNQSGLRFGEGYIPLVNIGNLIPTNLFKSSSKVPTITLAEFQQHKEAIEGQRRSVQLLQENLGLVLDLHTAEGLQIDGAIAQQKNQIRLGQLNEQQVLTEIQGAKVTYQRTALEEQLQLNEIKTTDISLREIELQSAHIRNDIAQLKQDQLGIDRNGEEQMIELHQQTWDLKLEGLRIDIANATNQLEQKRQTLNAQTLKLS